VIWNAGVLHPPPALLRVGRPPFATSSAIAVRLLRHRLSHAELARDRKRTRTAAKP
jgi:hypothetical protein